MCFRGGCGFRRCNGGTLVVGTDLCVCVCVKFQLHCVCCSNLSAVSRQAAMATEIEVREGQVQVHPSVRKPMSGSTAVPHWHVVCQLQPDLGASV